MDSLNDIPISGNLRLFSDDPPRKHDYESEKIDVFGMETCRRACVIINQRSESMEATESSHLQLLKKIENYMFDLGAKLGQGSFSQVFRGVETLSGRAVAVKRIRIGEVKSKIARRLLQCEVSILRLVKHPNILACLDVHQSQNNCYIITQLCSGGDLDSRLSNCQHLDQKQICKIILPIFEALLYLSRLSIIHRDVKVSNIFIDKDQYKLGDFGFAIRANKIFKDVAIGSPVYMSPQGLIYNLYGPKTDVWAFGLLMYELLHRTTPLAQCRSEEQLKKKVLETPKITAKCSPKMRELILNCLRVSETERFSFQEVAQSELIRDLRGDEQFIDLTMTKRTLSTVGSERSFFP